ncbi:hypothetical protein BLGI_4300 [Brevibacillus laterosporus GI-9]|nr:hypothetical protein BLGI_4300 [Brevibacillus laterosporus GI-9]
MLKTDDGLLPLVESLLFLVKSSFSLFIVKSLSGDEVKLG